MSLNAILRWLKPHEMVFFDLLEGSAENIYQATLHFDREIRMADTTRWPELRRQMKEYEHTGDEFTHQQRSLQCRQATQGAHRRLEPADVERMPTGPVQSLVVILSMLTPPSVSGSSDAGPPAGVEPIAFTEKELVPAVMSVSVKLPMESPRL